MEDAVEDAVPGVCAQEAKRARSEAAVPPSGYAEAAPPPPAAKRPRPVFRYGNYSAYYGYRVGPGLEDERLLALRPEWFAGRRCLDVGCNEGLVTLSLAVKYRTAGFEGVDIDGSLVRRAQAKLRSLQRASAEAAAETALLLPGESLREDRAALAEAGHALAALSFRRCNFLDARLASSSLDTVLCLSVSKWVHLNWGDEGLQSLFRRALDLLVPGGVFILEPQPWKSYSQAFRKQRMPEETREHFRSIKLRPTGFAEYLQSEVGFARVEELKSGGAGFDRALLVCHKAP